ncbi:MAG: InlB B-repeat-containing protein, partial [Bacteroidaceae bacterium]|nr:InlB B-repeat-containing protein [Bacteroidaceae bacterium]
GYTFGGWSDVPSTMPAVDVTVRGSFTINEYQITFVLNGGGYDNEVYRTAVYKFSAPITAPVAPTKTGYTFRGWDNLPAKMPSRDLTVVGSYEANLYTLTYMVDGEKYESQSVAYGTTLTPLAAPEKEGYSFSGWSDIPSTMPNHDLTIVGYFSISSYTVTFVLNGGSYDNFVYRTATYTYGSAISAPALVPIQVGYEFLGWVNVPATMPARDLTIVGNYKLIDAIDAISESGMREVYDLSGRRITTDVLPRGIYIINGKKTLIR